MQTAARLDYPNNGDEITLSNEKGSLLCNDMLLRDCLDSGDVVTVTRLTRPTKRVKPSKTINSKKVKAGRKTFNYTLHATNAESSDNGSQIQAFSSKVPPLSHKKVSSDRKRKAGRDVNGSSDNQTKKVANDEETTSGSSEEINSEKVSYGQHVPKITSNDKESSMQSGSDREHDISDTAGSPGYNGTRQNDEERSTESGSDMEFKAAVVSKNESDKIIQEDEESSSESSSEISNAADGSEKNHVGQSPTFTQENKETSSGSGSEISNAAEGSEKNQFDQAPNFSQDHEESSSESGSEMNQADVSENQVDQAPNFTQDHEESSSESGSETKEAYVSEHQVDQAPKFTQDHEESSSESGSEMNAADIPEKDQVYQAPNFTQDDEEMCGVAEVSGKNQLDQASTFTHESEESSSESNADMRSKAAEISGKDGERFPKGSVGVAESSSGGDSEMEQAPQKSQSSSSKSSSSESESPKSRNNPNGHVQKSAGVKLSRGRSFGSLDELRNSLINTPKHANLVRHSSAAKASRPKARKSLLDGLKRDIKITSSASNPPKPAKLSNQSPTQATLTSRSKSSGSILSHVQQMEQKSAISRESSDSE